MTEHRTDKRAVRAAFERAAERYDSAAAVQREICARLADFALRFTALGLPPHGITLDAGCGTGYGLHTLGRLNPGTHYVGLDLSPAMLARARRTGGAGVSVVCGDLEQLPLASGSVALAWSSLALQWCAPAAALGELGRVLAPTGRAVIATLGPRTLYELDAAFAAIDHAEHRIRFHSAAAWSAHADGAGLEVEGVENFALQAVAPDLRGLLQDIKTIGANTVTGRRRNTPMGREAWQRLERRYETHRRPDGLLPATYDVILLSLRKPATARRG